MLLDETMTPIAYPMYIGGKAVRGARSIPVVLPFDGAVLGTIYLAEPQHVEAAVAAACDAAPVMRAMSLDQRASILRGAAESMMKQREEFALLVSSETGKPIREAWTEVERAAATLAFSSEEAHRLHGEIVPMDAAPGGKGRWGMTVREPRGVIGAITPFNFPLNLATHKIGPALAGGNAIVLKPSSATALSSLRLAEVFVDCGLPAGALNVITGAGGTAGAALVHDPRVAMITFTGSPEVGIGIRRDAGLRPVTLELGSNSAVIIEADANLEEAVPRCRTGAFANSGQVCISLQRIFVQQRIAPEFIERFLTESRKLVIGHPHDPETEISSLISENEAERVETWIQEAVARGAKLLLGGKRKDATVEPTVLGDVPDREKVSCREIFGPVVCIYEYADLGEAIERVNRSDYGLQGGIYTSDLLKAFRAAREIHVGGFMINDVPQFRVDQMPYGGVKLSGLGREGPKYAIEEMTESKLICWKV